tara:strand:- start:953 stop:1351 length:399 start_codon:yes stop_codon:yes gene_type:complete
MLKITRKVEYALIALRHLQQMEQGQLSSAKSMASEYGIPQELLAKILQKLAKEKIVQALKGPRGGYQILKDPKKVNMTKFFEILEGPMGIMDCYFDSNCEQINGCTIREPINRINERIRGMFDKMTLADITF